MTSTPAGYKSPRISFIWITLSQVLCTLPLVPFLPLWVIGLCFFCIFWRWMVFLGRWSYPPKIARYALVVTAVFGLMVHFPRLLSIQPAVSLLVVTYYLKLLEMFKLKDVYVILILSYFVVASSFLFHEDVYMLPYFIAAIVLTTVALHSVNRTEHHLEKGGTFKKGILLCLQALPITICLFLFFPRFPPFWVLEIKKEGPSVGIDESMSPADVAELGAAEGIAFRVEFNGKPPEQRDLYWRVLTLSQFDGVNWQSLFSSLQAQAYFNQENVQNAVRENIQPGQNTYEYTLHLEPTQQPWLPTLDRPNSVNTKSSFMPDFTTYQNKMVTSMMSYEAISSTSSVLNLELSKWSRKQNTQLPDGFNVKSRNFAVSLFNEVNKDKVAFIDRLMNKFNSEPYFYTLKPGRYDKDMIDEFLFERRKGFCAHYASALTFLLRSVDIPSRVVIGYHGGEINPMGGHIVVNQYDAHAWVEAWLEGQGWVRLDPTAMVAPWRLLVGVEEMLRQSSSSEVPGLQSSIMRKTPWMNQVRFLIDYTNHRWNKYVVNFNQQSQRQFFENLFNDYSLTKLVMVMTISIAVFLVLIAVFALWQSRKGRVSPEDKYIQRVLKLLQRRELSRDPVETLNAFLVRIQPALTPKQFNAISQVFKLYSKAVYENLSENEYDRVIKRLRKETYISARLLQHVFQ